MLVEATGFCHNLVNTEKLRLQGVPMVSTVDMHTHSNISDGSSSPEELMLHAKELGLHTIALTDHDTTAGLSRAAVQADLCGIRLIPGIELSTRYLEKEVHILGYYCNTEDPEFCRAIAELQQIRIDKNQRILKHMQNDGIPVTMEEICCGIGESMVTRAHFARFLVNHGYVTSMNEAFARFLGEGRPYYEAKVPYPSADAVRLIRKAGGFAYLAHPGLTRLSEGELEGLIRILVDAGLNGIEAYHSKHKPEDTSFALKMAETYHLAVSGGSDYHAKNKPDIELGVGCGDLVLTEELVAQLDALRSI